MNPIENNALIVLIACVEKETEWINGYSIQDWTSLSPNEINDAVEYLAGLGAIRVEKASGTAPFNFFLIGVLTKGRYLYHEISNNQDIEKECPTELELLPKRPYNPVGSPYGFTENDWENVSLQKEDRKTLYVVMGLQFESKYYDTETILKNFKSYFENSVRLYNDKNNDNISLKFEKLEAGYGGHLFNQIASNIIGSDIAIFETSDKNSNVMIELGVALTWGIRILPIREKNSPGLPSDISGHTWIIYEKSGEKVLDEKFPIKLETMIKRVIALK